MWPVSRNDRSAGFTLIEVLVALAVFSVMTLLAYQGLSRMTAIKLHLDQEMRFWRELTVVLDRMESDFTQLSTRNWNNAKGVAQPPLRAATSEESGRLIELIRLDGRREPMHMAYRWQEKNLDLLVWPDVDVSATQNPKVHALLKDVETFEISFLNTQKKWATEWRTDPWPGRPLAVRIRLGFHDRGVFERVVVLP